MTQEEIKAIKERLEKSIITLEEQTAVLKKDLETITHFLNNEPELDDELSAKLSSHQHSTQNQIAANKELLSQFEEVNEEVNEENVSLISNLEKETVAMLKRMQHKVNTGEMLSDLYESESKKTKTTEPAKDNTIPNKEKPESLEEEVKKIKAEQEMENTIKKFKDQDALNDLKKKLGL